MIARAFHIQVGPYWLALPGSAQVSCEVSKTSAAYTIAHTHWIALIGRFRLGIHLDPINELCDLKQFIDHSTKSDVATVEIAVNGVEGVMHGAYASPVTEIDWWFKKGDTMICLNLQGLPFPFRERPTDSEVAEHRAIIDSLRYCRDFPSGPPSL